MGGAAAVLGTGRTAAQMKLPVRIIGVIPATENGVDGAARETGDVVGSYSGKTIEVIDTMRRPRLIPGRWASVMLPSIMNRMC